MDALRNANIVCFANDWDSDPRSNTQIMRILARENRILWVNSLGNRSPRVSRSDLSRVLKKLRDASRGVREVERNIYVLAPLYLPVYGGPALEAANRTMLRLQVLGALRWLDMARPVSWSFLPSAARVAGTLGESLIIYHVIDEYSALTGASSYVPEMEQHLLARADLVITCSEPLLRCKASASRAAVLVRHGVDFEHFARALDPSTRVPEDLARLPRPIIGFFGLIADWIDLELVREVADAHPAASVVLIGSALTTLRPLAGARNVHLLGRKPYADLPAYCRGFHVALTPFRLNELSRNANPLKAREYVAAGLPNICTDLPELRAIPGCSVAASRSEFVQKVGEALAAGGPSKSRSELMRPESWDQKVEEIRGHIAALLDRRRAA